jgi:hypothetical protein
MYFKNFPKMLYDFDITKVSGSGTQAKATAFIAGGAITGVSIDDGGTGYVSADVIFSAPNEIYQGSQSAAQAFAVVNNGSITEIVMTNGGAGYTSTPTVTISTPYTTLETQTKALILTDITRNIRFRRDILANITVYDFYDVVEGETPEIVAEKIYGNAQYHWIVMLVNERYDYLGDWPLTQPALDAYVIDKYGSTANSIHHYENSKGITVASDYPSAVPITNANYEAQVNESKRRIKIISAQLLSTILKNFKDEI